MKLIIEYFAVFKEQAAVSQETIEVSEATLPSVFELCKSKHGFRLEQNQVRVAVNDEFVEWDHDLSESDRVVFLPPVAGG